MFRVTSQRVAEQDWELGLSEAEVHALNPTPDSPSASTEEKTRL